MNLSTLLPTRSALYNFICRKCESTSFHRASPEHRRGRLLSNAVGLFHVDIEVLAASGRAAERQTVLADTGASYLSLSASALRRMGYEPIATQRVVFATGETAIWPVTEVKVRLEGRERTVLAFLAGEQ